MESSSTGKSSAPTEFVWVKSSLEVSTGSISYLGAHACGRRRWPLKLFIDVEFCSLILKIWTILPIISTAKQKYKQLLEVKNNWK